jgi:hypothetical protein
MSYDADQHHKAALDALVQYADSGSATPSETLQRALVHAVLAVDHRLKDIEHELTWSIGHEIHKLGPEIAEIGLALRGR